MSEEQFVTLFHTHAEREREAMIASKKNFHDDILAEMKEATDFLSVSREGLPTGVLTMILEGLTTRRMMVKRLEEEVERLVMGRPENSQKQECI